MVFVLNDYLSGYVDVHYNQFLAESNSLVIGSSRAHFAVDPSHFKEHSEMLNFAMTGDRSPYGPLYNKAIKKKIEAKDGEKGLFILEMNPFTLSREKVNEDDDPARFVENKYCLGSQVIMNMNPNYEYILRNLTPLYEVPTGRVPGNGNILVHKNGWVEFSLDMSPKANEGRTKFKMDEYRKLVLKQCPSELRIKCFKELITYLKQYGDVYLVRLPVGNEMYELENKYWPGFEEWIKAIADSSQVTYFNLQNDFPNPITIDGNHLIPSEAQVVSALLHSKIIAK